MTTIDQAALVGGYLDALANRDDDALERLRGDDFVEEWPQSGERVVGRANMRAVETAHPARPTIVAGPRVTTLDDNLFVAEAMLDYAGAPTWLVERFEMHRDGRIHRVHAYFADPFEPPDYRAPFVERYDAIAELDEPPATPHGSVGREVAVRYGKAIASADLDAIRRLAHADWRGIYPQSGERYPDVQAIIAAHDPYPGGLPEERLVDVAGAEDRWALSGMLTPVRVSGSGACWMWESAMRYPNGERWFNVSLTTFRDGLAYRDRMYWARQFEAPAWRQPFVERFDVG